MEAKKKMDEYIPTAEVKKNTRKNESKEKIYR